MHSVELKWELFARWTYFLFYFLYVIFFSSSQVCCASNKNICTHIWRRNETETILHKVTHTHMLADVGALTRTWNDILLNWKKYEKKQHIFSKLIVFSSLHHRLNTLNQYIEIHATIECRAKHFAHCARNKTKKYYKQNCVFHPQLIPHWM